MDIRIHIAAQSDVPAMTDIYNQAVESRSATAELSPVSIESRCEWLRAHNPEKHPVFVALDGATIAGWCSLSPYRPGRLALRHTAEISYYVDGGHRRMGIGSRLISHAVDACPGLGIKTLFAILLDINVPSIRLLEKSGFRQWGHMPDVADFDGRECGHLYYGRRVVQ